MSLYLSMHFCLRLSQLLFDPQETIILCHPLRTAGRAGLNQTCIECHCNIRNKGILSLPGTVGNDGPVTCILSGLYLLEGFSEGADLIHLDQDRVCSSQTDPFFQPLCICDKKIISNNLPPVSDPLRQKLPPFPVFLIQRIFYRADRKFRDQIFIISYHLFRCPWQALVFSAENICVTFRVIYF